MFYLIERFRTRSIDGWGQYSNALFWTMYHLNCVSLIVNYKMLILMLNNTKCYPFNSLKRKINYMYIFVKFHPTIFLPESRKINFNKKISINLEHFTATPVSTGANILCLTVARRLRKVCSPEKCVHHFCAHAWSVLAGYSCI